MKSSIHQRLFHAMLALLIVVVATATSLSAYFAVRRADHEQSEEVRRVVRTLSEANYPVTQPVLDQVQGFCGAEFIYVDESGALGHATVPVSREGLAALLATPLDAKGDLFDRSRVARIENRDYYVGATDVRRGGRLFVLDPRRSWWAITLEATWPIWISGAMIMLVATFLAARVASLFVHPIERLRRQVHAIADGDYEPVALPSHDDEIRELAVGINQMAARIDQHERDVRKSERLAALSQLGVGIAHQLRNCATGARMAVEFCHRAELEPREAEAFRRALRQLHLLETHIQRFLTLGRSADRPREPVAVAPLLERVVSLIEPGCDHQGIEIALRPPDASLRVLGDEESLTQLLSNLTMNAVESVSACESRERRIEIDAALAGQGDVLRIDVADSGPGPSEDVASEIFEPFVTSKSEGAGLGLYLAREVARRHGGDLTWRRDHGWTHFVVQLPTLPENR